jgi:hypothetical protein
MKLTDFEQAEIAFKRMVENKGLTGFSTEAKHFWIGGYVSALNKKLLAKSDDGKLGVGLEAKK